MTAFVCRVHAQCGSTISSFPYTESFESGPGGWSSGGTNNDWAMGAPNKAFIQSAGAGINCWVSGGLTGSFYSFGQRSYVTSPCFDFTNVSNPHVSFKIYWETENIYDGATFQYSTNNGVTWTNVGTNTDPVDCLNQNWFNQSNITALSTLANPKQGWAGTVLPTSGSCTGGNGSLGWVTAKHCMSNLAGLPSVQFRFAFGAGTICNAYDGFAFDDIVIGEAPTMMADFSSACTSTALQYQFTNTSTSCPSTFTWDFGDPVSGINNTSSLQNPLHVFSSPGTYNVTLTISGPCNASASVTKTVQTLDLTAIAMSPLCAGQNNGSILASGSNYAAPPFYTLQPGGNSNNNGGFNNLNSGLYTVTLSDGNGCSLTTAVSIQAPTPILWNSVQQNNMSCFGIQNGSINAQAGGGSGSINYLLNPGNVASLSGQYNNLNAGSYTVTATDANGCTLTTICNILQPALLTFTNAVHQDVNCYNGNDATINVMATGGTGSITYQLMPGGTGNSSGVFTGLSAGTYTITASDVNACNVTTIILVTQPTQLQINGVNITQPGCVPGNDGVISVLASGGSGQLNYSIGGSFSTSGTFSSMSANTYTITVMDAKGCTATSSVTLISSNAPVINTLTLTDILCAGQQNGSIQIQAGNGQISIQEYSLSPGGISNTNGLFTGLSAGDYIITVTDANQCTRTTLVTLQQPEALIITSLDYSQDSCGQNVNGTLKVTATGGTGNIQFQLNPGAINSSNGIFYQLSYGNYILTATDANGCAVDRPVQIKERICCENVFVPSAFSPNDDGRNDELRMLNTAGTEIKDFMIYNRWGNVVFNNQSGGLGWDGKYLGEYADVGTYFYLIRYTCLSTQKVYTLKGDVTLIR